MAGFSVLWNTDNGVVVFIAWTATMMLDAWALGSERRAVYRSVAMLVLYGSLALGLSLAAYSWFAWIRSGYFPDWVAALQYQSIFYGSGFNMLPMPLWELWQPAMLMYGVALFYSLRQAKCDPANRDPAWYFFIALYGLGAFSYYQGRSHIHCLLAPTYPAGVQACFFLVDVWQQMRSSSKKSSWLSARRSYARLQLIAFSVFIVAGVLNLCLSFPAAVRYARDITVSLRPQPTDAVLLRAASLVGRTPCIILSNRSNYFYIKTGSCSAMRSSRPTKSCSSARPVMCRSCWTRGKFAISSLSATWHSLPSIFLFANIRCARDLDRRRSCWNCGKQSSIEWRYPGEARNIHPAIIAIMHPVVTGMSPGAGCRKCGRV